MRTVTIDPVCGMDVDDDSRRAHAHVMQTPETPLELATYRRYEVRTHMATEYESVAIWVGHFLARSALTAYLSETCTDDDSTPISQFAADLGEVFYNHDSLEHSFHEFPSRDLSTLLKSHSFSWSYLAAAVTAFQVASLPPNNTIILVWGEEIRNPASVHRHEYWVHYLGRFESNPNI